MTTSKIALVAALVLAGGSLAACGEDGNGTEGFATSCETYLELDAAGQEKVVRDIALEGDESDPDQSDVDSVRELFVTICEAEDDQSLTLEDVSGGY